MLRLNMISMINNEQVFDEIIEHIQKKFPSPNEKTGNFEVPPDIIEAALAKVFECGLLVGYESGKHFAELEFKSQEIVSEYLNDIESAFKAEKRITLRKE